MRILALALLTLAAACGTSSAVPAAAPASQSPAAGPASSSPAALATATRSSSVVPVAASSPAIPYFSTPVAAMRYLTDAWNRHDTVALKHVTTPIGRDALESMRQEAVDLRLTGCVRNNDRQDYDCTFTHGFPVGYQGHPEDAGYARSAKSGTATFVVGPATRSGWYMTVLESCG